MSKVFLVDSHRRPLDPIHPGWARRLLSSGQAAVLRRYPFTLILKKSVEQRLCIPTDNDAFASTASQSVSRIRRQGQALRIKLDPGSRTTGIAIVNDQTGEVVFAAELTHRGQKIKKALDGRGGVRRSRRNRHTRYRQPRWRNRHRSKGWLPPSLQSRMVNVLTWVQRFVRSCPISAISMELVKFDLQKMQQPEIQGVEYQQGTLFGYEVREYLLEKWQRRCAYCGAKEVPLQVEHLAPKAKGGTDRVSNLCLACEPCNTKKGTQDVSVFLKNKPEVLTRLQAQTKAPLKDTAAVNAARWELHRRLQQLGLPVEVGTGGRTKFNRVRRNLEKAHWLDAACVGASTPLHLIIKGVCPLLITATGYGNRQLCGVNKHGFPTRHRQRKKVHHGYQTGDLVRAVVPKGTHIGTHVGRVLARATGSFDLRTAHGRVEGVLARYCHPIHRNDGYSYQTTRGGNSSPI